MNLQYYSVPGNMPRNLLISCLLDMVYIQFHSRSVCTTTVSSKGLPIDYQRGGPKVGGLQKIVRYKAELPINMSGCVWLQWEIQRLFGNPLNVFFFGHPLFIFFFAVPPNEFFFLICTTPPPRWLNGRPLMTLTFDLWDLPPHTAEGPDPGGQKSFFAYKPTIMFLCWVDKR